MMKIAVDSRKMDFRPKMSLNLAKMTMTAAAGCKSLLHSGVDSIERTNITQQVAGEDPAYVAKATKVLSNGNQSCDKHWYLHIGYEHHDSNPGQHVSSAVEPVSSISLTRQK